MIQLYQTLDLRPIGIPQTLRLSQYDSDFEIIFELTNFDGTWILDTNTTAEVQGTKTDGHGYSADAVFDDQLKTVTIAGDVQMTAAAGRNVFEVVLFHDGDRLGSKNFVLDVERAALDAETTASDSKIKNFTAMTEAAETAAETATAAAEAAEEAAARGGLSDEAKAALLNCFAHVAWIDDNGQTYYDALEEALAPATLVSIDAVFTQGSAAIYADDTLDDLKQYLVVTAYYNDGTHAVIPAASYDLSGTLTVGESTITATYGEQTDTFTVTVSSALDRIAYDNLTYRDIFVEGNMITIGDFEDDDISLSSTDVTLPNGDKYKINAGSPAVTGDWHNTGVKSLKAFGTGSAQIRYRGYQPPQSAHVMLAATVKCDRYTRGSLGAQANLQRDGEAGAFKNINASITRAASTPVQIVTVDDYSSASAIAFADSFIGTYSSANADAYVDTVVFAVIPSAMTQAEAAQLYSNYIDIVNSEV